MEMPVDKIGYTTCISNPLWDHILYVSCIDRDLHNNVQAWDINYADALKLTAMMLSLLRCAFRQR